MSKAQELFDLQARCSDAENRMSDELLKTCGIDPDKPEAWPVTFDSYDGSFEFKRVTVGWLPTLEQINACFDMGFLQCWICYTDGRERYCSRKHGISELHRRPTLEDKP